MIFTAAGVEYLAAQPLGRLAALGPGGIPGSTGSTGMTRRSAG